MWRWSCFWRRSYLLRWRLKTLLGCCAGALFMLIMLASLTVKQDLANDSEGLFLDTSRELNKDTYHVVTAASSEEFGSLLKLIDSLLKQAQGFSLLVWSLDLRSCELNYLLNLRTSFKLSVNEFPFHFHPLHVRSAHMNAYRPIIMEISTQSLGQILWIDPTGVISTDPLPLVGKLTDHGYVASTLSNTNARCSSRVIGINYFSRFYNDVLKPWANCARNRSCILPFSEKARREGGEDQYLDGLVKQNKLQCTPASSVESQASLSGGHFPSLVRWKSREKTLCSPRKGCILTGSHQSHGCLTPQLAKLRQNKRKYAKHHGYAYLEETHGFHRKGPCHRVWNKVHAILKYLGDCEILLWIDTDAVFTDIGKSLASFFEDQKGMELLLSQPISDKILNAGVLLMRGTKSVRDFFVNVTNGNMWTGDWCHKATLEQSAINDQLQSGWLNGKYLIKRDDRYLQSLCGYKNGKCKWTENDFIAHFAPPSCPELGNIVRNFLDKYPRFVN